MRRRLRLFEKVAIGFAVVAVHITAVWFAAKGSIAEESEMISPELLTSGVFFLPNDVLQEGQALYEASELLDTAPLFLPTVYNYTSSAIRLTGPVRGEEDYEIYGARILTKNPSINLSSLSDSIDMRMRLASLPKWAHVAPPQAPKQPVPMSLKLHLKRLSGEEIQRSTLEVDADALEVLSRFWHPVKITARMDAFGLSGSVRITDSSGDDAVDALLVSLIDTYLHEEFAFGDGVIVVLVAP